MDLALAVRDHHLVKFRYEDLMRIVEPHTYGVLRNGTVAICAYLH